MRFTLSSMAMIMMMFVAGLLSVPFIARAAPPLALDGVGTPTMCDDNGNCNTELTTTRGHDAIILIAECGYLECSATISSVTDSVGLVYKLRTSFAPSDRIWEYYARAESPLTNDSFHITGVSISGNLVLQVFAVNLVNTNAIFDPSPSLPVTIPCSGNTGSSCFASIGTLTHDFTIAIEAINDDNGCAVENGFTEITPGGRTFGRLEVQYRVVGATQDNIIFTCEPTVFPGGTTQSTAPRALMVDALSFRGPSP